MLATIKLKTENFFTKGHERTLKAKKNIAISFLLKGISIAIGLVLIPMTINYVNTTQYGIWLTLSSVISWFSFFDIGLGNGLKNKLAEANAKGDVEKARIYISTTYAILVIISFFIFVCFFFLNRFINWNEILNTDQGYQLSHVALLVVSFFCLQFVIQLINVVLTALHVPSKVSAINVVGQFCYLCCLFVLTQKTNGSLMNLVLVLAGVPLLIQVISSIWLFKTSFKSFSPRIGNIHFKYAKSLLSMGAVFFIIQIGALVLFQTDNIVITQLFGPQEVTTFNIAYKLFSVVTMVFAIVMTPFWSAFTDAYARNDNEWIKNVMQKMIVVLVWLCFVVIILLFLSPFIYEVWLNGKIQIPFSLSATVSLCAIVNCWMMVVCYFLNGINKIRLQFYLYVVGTIVNIPLAVFLGRKIGLIGIPISNLIVLSVMATVLHVQCKKVINNQASGIWNR